MDRNKKVYKLSISRRDIDRLRIALEEIDAIDTKATDEDVLLQAFSIQPFGGYNSIYLNSLDIEQE